MSFETKHLARRPPGQMLSPEYEDVRTGFEDWDDFTVGLEQLVEDVVGPLHLLLLGDTRLLEQVGHNVATGELSTGGEVDSDELSEPGGVVVPRGLGVAVGLQDGVGGHDLVLKRDLLLHLLAGASGHHGQVGDHL